MPKKKHHRVTAKVSPKSNPRSREIARKGIKTDSDFADLMSALMSDVISGEVSPGVANATCNAGGKLLKVVELRQRYGTAKGQSAMILAHSVPLLPSNDIPDA